MNPDGEGGGNEAVRRRRESELELVRRNGWDEVFETALAIGRTARDAGFACRLTGAAGCSRILYEAGLSWVDPLRHGLPGERFLTTFDGRPPRFSFSADPAAVPRLRRFLDALPGRDRSRGLFGLHPATPTERIVHRATGRAGLDLRSLPDDPHALRGLFDASGEFHGPGADELKRLSGGRIPESVGDLAVLSALSFVELTDRTAAETYRAGKHASRWQGAPEIDAVLWPTRGVVLFQEQAMRLLNVIAGIELGESYRVVLRAARAHAPERDRLLDEIVVASRANGVRPALSTAVIGEILRSCRYAACRAHHLGEAAVTYAAAFLRRYHRDAFERACLEVTTGG